MEKAYFDQCLECAALSSWSEYTKRGANKFCFDYVFLFVYQFRNPESWHSSPSRRRTPGNESGGVRIFLRPPMAALFGRVPATNLLLLFAIYSNYSIPGHLIPG